MGAMMIASTMAKNILPIQIPIERCYDTQWNPPGHPLLSASFLRAPYKDRQSEQRDGYYTFEITANGEISSFVRVTEESSTIIRVFDKVDFLVISEDILFFNGDPSDYWAGGGNGTLIKGKKVTADNSGGTWATQSMENSNMTPEEWLLKNFGDEEHKEEHKVEPAIKPTESLAGVSLKESPRAKTISVLVHIFSAFGLIAFGYFLNPIVSKYQKKKKVLDIKNAPSGSSAETVVIDDTLKMDNNL